MTAQNTTTLPQTVCGIDLSKFPTPAFVVNLDLLERNLRVLDEVQQRSGAKILLALKGFALFCAAPLIMKYLKGTTASGLHELLLGANEFGGERHVYSPAYDERDFSHIVANADHIVFNSGFQWQRFRPFLQSTTHPISAGIRVNPGYSEVEVDLYNPCAKFSRLGTTRHQFDSKQLIGIEGLHFHAMCEQNSDVLERILHHVEALFGDFIKGQCRWVNFGGGHHITRDDYNLNLLIDTIRSFKSRFPVDVYLEPGEAVGLNTGILVTRVLDVVHNELDIAILDTSASTHMPDVLEMPYRPQIAGAGRPGELAYTYRLGGLTCLAGDVIGDYSFPAPLKPGDLLAFMDMAHYSMVKTTTFNGVPLPSICTYQPSTGEAKVVRTFGYEEYRNRLS